MDRKDPKLIGIWNQKRIPVVFQGGKSKPLLIRLPFSKDNRLWLKSNHRSNPKWFKDQRYWKIPKSWFEDIIKRLSTKFGEVYVIQSYHTQQKCAPACWNASGIECECSCMGANHGTGNILNKWYVVSDTFAVCWGDKQYSCRLISPNKVTTEV